MRVHLFIDLITPLTTGRLHKESKRGSENVLGVIGVPRTPRAIPWIINRSNDHKWRRWILVRGKLYKYPSRSLLCYRYGRDRACSSVVWSLPSQAKPLEISRKIGIFGLTLLTQRYACVLIFECSSKHLLKWCTSANQRTTLGSS